MMPLPGRPRIFRDPVHGDIAFTRDDAGALANRIVENSVVQRLRRIRQNGVTNLVFPGLEHSRFTHSLGAYSLAGRMYDFATRNAGVARNARDRSDVELAALLHDVGHGPYSHALEEILGAARFSHEKMTVRLAPDLYAGIDETARVSYKRYAAGEGAGGAIRLIRRNGSVVAVEDDPRSIADFLARSKQFHPRLIVHPDVRDAVRAQVQAG